MTDSTAQEPTMEEILASIRRIISEDDAPAEAAAPAAAPEPEPVYTPEPEPASFMAAPEPEPAPAPVEPEDDVLELTDVYEAPEAESIGDLDVFSPEPEPAPAPRAAPTPSYDSLVGESAAASAASAFAGLASSLKKPAPAAAPSGGDLSFMSGSTVEGMVAEMLRPMIKDWLDANLPGIVETAVKAEVERIARSAT
ncbi:DUF2497 domain-containing protein [Brevundimonas sp.]|jgi:cell pole-organizing protein PopZ|uniref:DUF2497 domain-containing protein n=1 Tax=Brevundimonas sp. TaxID=1871086 RepID=UPI003784487A